MSLSLEDRKELDAALQEAFPGRDALARMLALELGKNLESLVIGDDLKEVVFEVVNDSEAEGWTLDLVAAACRANPGADRLRALAARLGVPVPPRPASQVVRRRWRLAVAIGAAVVAAGAAAGVVAVARRERVRVVCAQPTTGIRIVTDGDRVYPDVCAMPVALSPDARVTISAVGYAERRGVRVGDLPAESGPRVRRLALEPAPWVCARSDARPFDPREAGCWRGEDAGPAPRARLWTLRIERTAREPLSVIPRLVVEGRGDVEVQLAPRAPDACPVRPRSGHKRLSEVDLRPACGSGMIYRMALTLCERGVARDADARGAEPPVDVRIEEGTSGHELRCVVR